MSFFAPDLFWTYLKWLMILAVWAAPAYGIYRDHRRMRLLEPTGEAGALLQALHQRTIQLALLLSLLLIVSAINDVRYDAAKEAAERSSRSIATAEEKPVAPERLPAATPSPYEKTLDKMRPGNVKDMPFSDITEFNEQNSKQQAYLDWLKQRYEAWLVTYYYLDRCKETQPQDLPLIRGALGKELQDAHADDSVGTNILLAASGSYNEMYSGIPCDKAHLEATKATYDANMQQLKEPSGAVSKPPAPGTTR